MNDKLPRVLELTLKRFSRAKEGGPGRPATLLIHGLAAGGLLGWGNALMNAYGISSAGPMLILLALLWGGTLLLWVLVKAGFRDPRVVVRLDAGGISLRPSAKQKRLDRRIRFFVHLAFLLSFKGGQWASWESVVSWKKVKALHLDGARREILVKGGPWDIRIACTPRSFPELKTLILSRVSQECRLRER